MGLSFSRIWERMFGKKEMRILMVGLDAAGKVDSCKRIIWASEQSLTIGQLPFYCNFRQLSFISSSLVRL